MKKIAVLTGATGGLGQEFVNELLKEDIDEIWAVARNIEKLNKLCEKFGSKIYPVKCDLSDVNQVKNIENLFEQQKPKIKYLINNAGIGLMKKCTDFSESEITNLIDLNCKIPALLCNYAIPYMDKGSRILNISSASSFQPNPYIAFYSASKVFLRSFSRSLNFELKQTGITCTAVCPGWIDTDMLEKEYNGKKVKFPGLVSANRVAVQALKDAKKGKDMSVCSLFVKYEHLCSKIMPQKWSMYIWEKGVKKYV